MEGTALANTSGISIKFDFIQQGTGTNVYSTTQIVSTDPYGVFSTTIGEGDAAFGAINFLDFDYRLDVSINGTIISSKKFDAVPYAKMAEKAANGTIPGAIIAFAGNVVPPGYVACNGQSYDGTDPQYKGLFDAIGTIWGGAGSTFNVPDLRGYFLRGIDSSAGNDPDALTRTGGDAVGSTQNDEVGSHDHTMQTDGAHQHNYTDPIIGSYQLSSDNSGTAKEYPTVNAGVTPVGGAHSHDIDPAGGNETRPKNKYVLYIIKL